MASEKAFLRFGANSQEKYQFFREKIFSGASNSQVFFLAMAFGYKYAMKAPADFPKSNNGPRTEISEEDFALMKVLQFSQGENAGDLSDADARYDLAMRFAESGINLLWERFGHMTPREAREELLIMMHDLMTN
jgi:hypothetical protein